MPALVVLVLVTVINLPSGVRILIETAVPFLTAGTAMEIGLFGVIVAVMVFAAALTFCVAAVT